MCVLSHVQLFGYSMDCSLSGSSVHGIFQAESWSWLLFPMPGDLSNSGIEPVSPHWYVDSLPLHQLGRVGEVALDA